MNPIQLKLKSLRERQSRERGRMAELAVADSLTDETRQELDALETGCCFLLYFARSPRFLVELIGWWISWDGGRMWQGSWLRRFFSS